tara:strand:- start:81 stop:344 length:264 start_codon:yes stop_codon:yes gene_type:complete
MSYTVPEKNIWKLPNGKIWEGVAADLPVSQADMIAKSGHEYPTAWLKEQGWKKAPAKKAPAKKAEPAKAKAQEPAENKAAKVEKESK